MLNSKWNVFIGTAAEDKFYNSNLLKVFVTELFPNLTGSLADQTTKENVKIKQVKTKKNTIINQDISVKTSNIITAEYFGIFTNRTFSPDIRKGEQVLLIKYLDTDHYYWISLGRDDKLRQLEKFRLAISDSQKKVKDLDEDNIYYIEMDTLHKKSIVIRTSKGDKEKFRYIIHIDAKTNSISIEDDDKNYIHLESDIPRIKCHNKNGCFTDINKDDIFINTIRDLRINVGRMLYIKADSMVSDIETVNQINSSNIDFNSDSFTTKSKVVGIDGSLKVSKTIVTSAVRSGSYGSGNPGDPYKSPIVNSDINQVSTPTVSDNPDTDDSIGMQRHSAAYEQVKAALYYIADCMSQIGCPNSGEVKNLADACIIDKLKSK